LIHIVPETDLQRREREGERNKNVFEERENRTKMWEEKQGGTGQVFKKKERLKLVL